VLRLEPGHIEAKQMLAEGLEAAGASSEALELWQQLARDLPAAGASDRQIYTIVLHALELAPHDSQLLERASMLALEMETAAEARPLMERWLQSFDGDQ